MTEEEKNIELLAFHIMDWSECCGGYWTVDGDPEDEHGGAIPKDHISKDWNPYENIKDAFDLLDKISDLDFFYFLDNSPPGYFSCVIHDIKEDEKYISTFNKNQEEAICETCLKWIKSNENT